MTGLKSNAEWKQWGTEDPLWGVASWANKQKGGTSPWTNEEFYRLGESDWQSFLEHWRQYGLSTRSCLEIGCGAGRITRPLAKAFDHVYAVDVSEQMIGCARRAVEGRNVEYAVVDGVHLPQPDCAVTALFSTHVLQHLDSAEIGFSYFREFFRVLDRGGTIMVHLPLYQFPGGSNSLNVLMECLYTVSRRLGTIRADIRRHLGVKTMRGTSYPLQPLNRLLVDLGFRNIQFRIYPSPGNGDLHPFVFATKPLAGRRGASGAEALLHTSGNTVNRVLPESSPGAVRVVGGRPYGTAGIRVKRLHGGRTEYAGPFEACPTRACLGCNADDT